MEVKTVWKTLRICKDSKEHTNKIINYERQKRNDTANLQRK